MTTFSFRFPALLFTCAIAAPSLVACGGDSTDDSSADGSASEPSALTQRLSTCPVISASQDKSASTCLIGSYAGKTLAGEACSLEVLADNAYEFKSPKLNVSYTAPTDMTFLFDHTSVQGASQMLLMVSDPYSNAVYRDLDFTARFGSFWPDADRKIEIEVKEGTDAGDTTVACIVKL